MHSPVVYFGDLTAVASASYLNRYSRGIEMAEPSLSLCCIPQLYDKPQMLDYPQKIDISRWDQGRTSVSDRQIRTGNMPTAPITMKMV